MNQGIIYSGLEISQFIPGVIPVSLELIGIELPFFPERVKGVGKLDLSPYAWKGPVKAAEYLRP